MTADVRIVIDDSVGAALNVHEGPHSISKRYYITQPLQASIAEPLKWLLEAI